MMGMMPMRRLMRVMAAAPSSSVSRRAAVPRRTDRQCGFASQAGGTMGSYEDLKHDFARWARKELQLLAMLVLAGGAGVYFYRVR